jgi:proteasome accessory factor B
VRRTGRRGAYTPPEVDLISYVAHWSGQPVERTGRATILAAHGRAAGVRRWAEEITPGPDGDRLTLRFAEPEWFAAWLVGYGADVVVLDPPEVRDAVVARLKEIAQVYQAAPVPSDSPAGVR